MSEVDDSDIINANQDDEKVLRNSLAHDGLARGLNETTKAIESGKALVCFISNSCSEPAYKNLINALCKEHSVPLIEIDGDSKTLGQWAGLCKIDPEGKPRNIVGTTSAAIKNYGEESEALNFLKRHLETITVK